MKPALTPKEEKQIKAASDKYDAAFYNTMTRMKKELMIESLARVQTEIEELRTCIWWLAIAILCVGVTALGLTLVVTGVVG